MAEPLRRRVRTQLLRGLTGAAGRAPEPLVRGLLSGAAALARFSRYERLALENLELALGAETTAAERARIARGVRRHSARLVYEWARLAHGARSDAGRERMEAWLARTVRFGDSLAILERQRAAGGGSIIVTAHLGNWELLAAALHRRGLRGGVVARRKRDDSSSDWLVAMRRAYGVETFAQDASPRALLEVLRSGGTLGVLADLEARRLASECVPFFGIPALTMTAPAALARASGLPLTPARCVARGAVYELSLEAPLELDPRLARREATLDLCARLNATLERWIREDPEQWAWHQPRWRTRPEELPPGLAESGLAESQRERAAPPRLPRRSASKLPGGSERERPLDSAPSARPALPRTSSRSRSVASPDREPGRAAE